MPGLRMARAGAVTLAMLTAIYGWGFTYWQAGFIDSLATRTSPAFWTLISWFPALLIASGLLVGLTTLARTRWVLALRARELRTDVEQVVDAASYAASGISVMRQHDLVQATVEDTRMAADLEVGLTAGCVASVLGAVLFAVTLGLAFPLLQVGALSVPVPMVWFALLSFGFSSYALHRLGHRLPAAETEIAQREAGLRSTVARMREHAKSLVLLQGRAWEARALHRALVDVGEASVRASWLHARVRALGELLGPSDILAWLVLSPIYFAGDISFGQLFQVGMAHSGVGSALNWFVSHYGDWAKWRAAKQRVMGLRGAVADLRATKTLESMQDDERFVCQGLCLWMPKDGDQAVVVWERRYADLSVDAGERVVLRAPSGFGKSCLLAAMTGAWPWGRGKLVVPRDAVFVPQRPYFPKATLAQAIAYPAEESADTAPNALQCMRALGLEHLEARMNDEADWNATLSGGEAARLALVRALLVRPRWLFLDEPTANLDPASAQQYWIALRACTDLSIVLVAHGPHGLGASVREIDLSE